MLIAHTADWEIRGKDHTELAPQLEAFKRECIARKVDLVTHSGDVVNNGNIGDNHASTGILIDLAVDTFVGLADVGIESIVIPGNHDRAGCGSKDALYFLDRRPRITVIHNPTVINWRGLDVICLPWLYERKRAEPIIDELIKGYKSIFLFLAHVQVIGMKMNDNKCCEPGDGKFQVAREYLERLPVKHFAFGDFHDARQPYYTGAIRQRDFGFEGQPQGFKILDTETGLTEWVELTAAPTHHTEIVTEHDQASQCFDLYDERDHIRVRYEREPDPVEVRKLESAGVQVEIVRDRAERIRRAEVPAGILGDRHGMMLLWAGAQNPPIEVARLDAMIGAYDGLYADKKS